MAMPITLLNVKWLDVISVKQLELNPEVYLSFTKRKTKWFKL